MKEIFTEKEFTELLEQENFALGVTRSPKWTMYTRYTIVYKNYSFDDNYEIEDSDGNYMPKCRQKPLYCPTIAFRALNLHGARFSPAF